MAVFSFRDRIEIAVRLEAKIVHMVWIDRTYDMVATSRDFTLYIAKTAISGLGDELHDLVRFNLWH
jgi:hypothetical protein